MKSKKDLPTWREILLKDVIKFQKDSITMELNTFFIEWHESVHNILCFYKWRDRRDSDKVLDLYSECLKIRNSIIAKHNYIKFFLKSEKSIERETKNLVDLIDKMDKVSGEIVDFTV